LQTWVFIGQITQAFHFLISTRLSSCMADI